VTDEQQPRRKTGAFGAAGGIAAAVVIAVLLNVLAARHYQRFDWTEAGLYTLTPVTTQTLQDLSEPIEITVLLAAGDPLGLTVRHLLDAYGAKSRRLVVRYVDPERDAAAFLAIQQKYAIALGRTDSGQLVTDAAIVVARGKRHHFIASSDLVAIDQRGARPRVERVLTASIRRVVAGEAPRVCFTTGHGEPSLDQGGKAGLLTFAGRLEKNNYNVSGLIPLRDVRGDDPITTCRVVVVAAPARMLPATEVARLVAFAQRGGNLMVALGPVPNDADAGYVKMGLVPLLRELGVRQRDDFVFERAQAKRTTSGFGETFLASLRGHRITDGLMAGGGVDVVLTVASSLEILPTFAGNVSPLLVTSDEAFGMADFFAWARDPTQTPEPDKTDFRGPLTVAVASERVRPTTTGTTGTTESNTSRAVVVASSSVAYGANWQNAQLRGTALFMESVLSWLASEPIVLDIPDKPSHRAGLSVTKDMLSTILLQVVCLLPLAMALLGLFVRIRRSRTRRQPSRQAGEKAS
jgi:hypothetical protein